MLVCLPSVLVDLCVAFEVVVGVVVLVVLLCFPPVLVALCVAFEVVVGVVEAVVVV